MTDQTGAMRRPRVLFLLNHAGRGGTERYVEILVERLVPARIEAVLAYNEDGPLRERLEARGVECIHLPMASRFDRTAARSLAACCRDKRIDVVHAMFLREHYIAWLARFHGCRAARMATVHLMLDRPAKPPMIWLDRAVYRSMAKVVTVCDRLGMQMKAAYGLDGGKLLTVHNGIVPDPVMPGPFSPASGDDGSAAERFADARRTAVQADRDAVRAEFGIAPEAVLFLSAGRFTEEKGMGFLIDAIRAWPGGCPRDVRFLLAGDGALRAGIERAVREAGLADAVRFAGHRTDLPRLLRAADAYVSPSRSEALSLSVLEAMDAGLPVLATDVGGTPELVSPEGGNGMLVAYGDITACASGLARLAAEAGLRAAMGERGNRLARTRFTLDAMVERTAALYREITPH